MHPDRQFADDVERFCAPLGPVWTRNMFGGFGVYHDRAMFGLIAHGVLYLKTDAINRPDFDAGGLEPFVHHGATRTLRMSYCRAPDGSLDDWSVMEPWAQGAVAAAERALARRKPRRSKQAPQPPIG
jgi:DNA transformation protein and related proteins